MDREYIHEAMTKLKYKDKRSFYKWCASKGLRILVDIGSRRKFVDSGEFKNAQSLNLKENSIKKYGGEKSVEAIASYINFHSQIELAKQNKIINSKNSYQPMGQQEKVFLSSLTATSPEL